VLGAAEDEEAMVVTASRGTSWVPPGPGRQPCRETRSPRRNNAAVVCEAPPRARRGGGRGSSGSHGELWSGPGTPPAQADHRVARRGVPGATKLRWSARRPPC